jgi:hypothetical protein
MVLDPLRAFLLLGLLLHKAIWEVLRRRDRRESNPASSRPPVVSAVKLAKAVRNVR